MVVKERDRSHVEAELDRRIDLINVVFGAALGGYIGDIIGQASLTGHRGLVLALALIILVCLLVAVRNLLHLVRGTHAGSWKFPLAVVVAGIAFFYAIRGDTYLDLTALIPVAIGWAGAFAVVVMSHMLPTPGKAA